MIKKGLIVTLGIVLILSLSGFFTQAAKNVTVISVQDVWADNLMWGRAWLEIIKTFEEKNPDIKINRIYCPIGQNVERVLLQTKTKSLPDVITCDVPDIPHLAEAGALSDLSPFIKKWDT